MILGHTPTADARRTLAAGGAVSFYPSYVDNGQLRLSRGGAPAPAGQLAPS